MNMIEARYVYDLEQRVPERNYAKNHSFEEWAELRFGAPPQGLADFTVNGVVVKCPQCGLAPSEMECGNQ